MPSVTNVGGSLTSALALTALAAAVRLLRGAAAGRGRGGFVGFFGRGSGIDDDDDDENGTTVRGRSRRAVGRHFAPISPTSLRMLVRREKRKVFSTSFSLTLPEKIVRKYKGAGAALK